MSLALLIEVILQAGLFTTKFRQASYGPTRCEFGFFQCQIIFIKKVEKKIVYKAKEML